jgi:hypothetical protein
MAPVDSATVAIECSTIVHMNTTLTRLARSLPLLLPLAIMIGGCQPRVVANSQGRTELLARQPTPLAPVAEAAAPPPTPLEPLMTFDEAWTWLGTELPDDTAELRLVDDGLLEKLLAWAPPDGGVTVYDRRCRPLRLFRNETSLDGSIHVKTKVRGKRKTVSGESISFSWYIEVVCGFDNEYERGANGAWEEVGASATGCADTIGFSLSEVTATAAWYGGAMVDLQVRCGHTREIAQRCLDGSERTCASCGRLALRIRSHQSHYGVGSASSSMRTAAPGERTDCSIPCPADVLTPRVPAVNAALEGVELEQIGLEKHPTIFRTRAACREYRKRHRIPAGELDPW